MAQAEGSASALCYVPTTIPMPVPGEVAILRGWRLVTTVHAPALLGQAALLEPLGVDCPEVTTRLHTGGCMVVAGQAKGSTNCMIARS